MSSSIAPTVAASTATAAEDTAAPSTGDSTEATATETTTTESAPDDGEAALGDAGKKALDAMKAKWRAAEAEAKRVTDEVAALRAAAEGREAEHQATIESQKVKDDALAAANTKIAKANLRAAAAGKLADPTDALTFIDVSTFEVDDDGNTDEAALTAAIADLIKSKPYLAAQGGTRFQGEADGGARKESTPDIDAQIAEAEKAGYHRRAISLKREKSRAASN